MTIGAACDESLGIVHSTRLGNAMTIDACAWLIRHQQVVGGGPVWNMAKAAILDDGRVLEHIRATLRLMTSSAFLRLEIQPRAPSVVRTVTINASQHAFRNGMVRG